MALELGRWLTDSMRQPSDLGQGDSSGPDCRWAKVPEGREVMAIAIPLHQLTLSAKARASQLSYPEHKALGLFLGLLPMLQLALKLVGLCLSLAAVETLHGIVRNGVVAPRVGTKRAKRLSIFSGSILAFVVCYIWVPTLGIGAIAPLLLVGLLLTAFMALFDILLARYALKLKWRVILKDFNPQHGNYLSIGLVLLVFMPALAMRAQNVAPI